MYRKPETIVLNAEALYKCVTCMRNLCLTSFGYMGYLLSNFGVKGKMLRLIWNSFQDCSSRVLLNRHLSSVFRIEQGTRQGSICAPFNYTVNGNTLLEALQASPYGLRICDLSLASPIQADDIVLLSLSRHGLNELLAIC